MEFGINTNQQKFNEEIQNIASSLKNEFNVEVDRIKFISEFCNLFEEKLLKRTLDRNIRINKKS